MFITANTQFDKTWPTTAPTFVEHMVYGDSLLHVQCLLIIIVMYMTENVLLDVVYNFYCINVLLP